MWKRLKVQEMLHEKVNVGNFSSIILFLLPFFPVLNLIKDPVRITQGDHLDGVLMANGTCGQIL